MAHFAEIDENNIVLRVMVVNNSECINAQGVEDESVGIEFCKSLFGGKWIQTSYNDKIRKKYAVVGDYYDNILDSFISPKPYPSWILDETTYKWKAPIAYPTTGLNYFWDELILSWKKMYVEFIPTPNPVINKIIEYISSTDIFYDLGCGDGRVLIAASKIAANIKGIDIQPNMVTEATNNTGSNIIEGDLLDADLTNVSIIYMYLDDETTNAMKEKLSSLPTGTKIISYMFKFKDWEPTFTDVVNDIPLYIWIVE